MEATPGLEPGNRDLQTFTQRLYFNASDGVTVGVTVGKGFYAIYLGFINSIALSESETPLVVGSTTAL
ncbi:hypothetical protein FACS1894127_5770 [Clostridia bacterium]|nr:hypothetical protein FACS1894127_5770 [Clostridia bacterium]